METLILVTFPHRRSQNKLYRTQDNTKSGFQNLSEGNNFFHRLMSTGWTVETTAQSENVHAANQESFHTGKRKRKEKIGQKSGAKAQMPHVPSRSQ